LIGEIASTPGLAEKQREEAARALVAGIVLALDEKLGD